MICDDLLTSEQPVFAASVGLEDLNFVVRVFVLRNVGDAQGCAVQDSVVAVDMSDVLQTRFRIDCCAVLQLDVGRLWSVLRVHRFLQQIRVG